MMKHLPHSATPPERLYPAHRNPNTHKGHYGHALLIAGSYGRIGCAILAARAALRTGCGLLTVHAPSKCVDPLQTAVPEAMVSIDACSTHVGSLPDGLQRYDAVAIGPGIGTSEDTQEMLYKLLQALPPHTRLILDADALNIIALRPELLDIMPSTFPPILTPHDGEYQRLFGNESTEQVTARYGIVVVRKGHESRVYSPSGEQYTNHTGNAGMATAGSGDVLTGVLLGLSAQKRHTPYEAACLGVMVHGECGDRALRQQTEDSIIASDIVDNLRHANLWRF